MRISTNEDISEVEPDCSGSTSLKKRTTNH